MTSEMEKEQDSEDGMTLFRERLFKLRSEHGMSLATLAKKVGVSAAALSNIENGSSPKLEVALAIAEEFKVSLDWMTGRSDVQSCSIESISEMTGLDIDNLQNIIDTYSNNREDHVTPILQDNAQYGVYYEFFPELTNYRTARIQWKILDKLTKKYGKDVLYKCDLSDRSVKLYETYREKTDVPDILKECATDQYRDKMEMLAINEILLRPDFVKLVGEYIRTSGSVENLVCPNVPQEYTAIVRDEVLQYLDLKKTKIQKMNKEYFEWISNKEIANIHDTYEEKMIPDIVREIVEEYMDEEKAFREEVNRTDDN